jgi:DNA polymerase III epsilon subunit-like protein
VAADLCDNDGSSRDFMFTRIRSDGRMIKDGARDVHGITSRQAGRDGVSETAALGVLIGFAAQASMVLGHGVSFDRQVIEGLLLRRGKDARMWVRPGLQFIDTMTAATPVCRLPSGRDDGQFKWPSLDVACETILHEQPRSGHHSAWDDCQRTKRLYLALRSMNVLEAA